MPDKQNLQTKAGRVLVITRSTFLDVDKLVSAIVLSKLLGQRNGTEVDLYFGDKLPVSAVAGIVAPKDVNFREKLSPDYFTVSINRGNAKVKEVKWEEVDQDLKLIIYTDQGQLHPDDYKATPGLPAYDHIYTLGIKSSDEALNALGEFSGLWKTVHTSNLDIRGENQRYAENNFVYPDAKSFAECIAKFAQDQGLEVTSDEATELLACIYWKTNSLRNKYTTFDTLASVQQLIQAGGSIADAVHNIFATFSIVEVRARQEIYKSMRLTAEKIAFAQVSPETARQLVKTQPINPEKNPLFKLKDASTSFVLVPLSENSTLVLCSSRDDRINVKKLFSNYNYVGDALQAELLFNMNASDTEKEIKKILLKVFPRTPDTNQAAVAPKPQPQVQSEPTTITVPAPSAMPRSQSVDVKPQLPIEPQEAVEVSEPEPTPDELNEILPDHADAQIQPEIDEDDEPEENMPKPFLLEPDPLMPATEQETEDMVMVEVPASIAELGPADPLPSA